MNRTNFEHAFFALLMQVAVVLATGKWGEGILDALREGAWLDLIRMAHTALVTGNWWAGAVLGAGFFLGREHAQYEKKLTHGAPVGGLNPLAGFAFLWKSLDGCLDFVVPLIAVVTVATWRSLS